MPSLKDLVEAAWPIVIQPSSVPQLWPRLTGEASWNDVGLSAGSVNCRNYRSLSNVTYKDVLLTLTDLKCTKFTLQIITCLDAHSAGRKAFTHETCSSADFNCFALNVNDRNLKAQLESWRHIYDAVWLCLHHWAFQKAVRWQIGKVTSDHQKTSEFQILVQFNKSLLR